MLHCCTLPIVLILPATLKYGGVHRSYTDPWVTDEVLDGDERVVADIWIWVCHEFHRSCFCAQVCDNSRNAMSIW